MNFLTGFSTASLLSDYNKLDNNSLCRVEQIHNDYVEQPYAQYFLQTTTSLDVAPVLKTVSIPSFDVDFPIIFVSESVQKQLLPVAPPLLISSNNCTEFSIEVINSDLLDSVHHELAKAYLAPDIRLALPMTGFFRDSLSEEGLFRPPCLTDDSTTYQIESIPVNYHFAHLPPCTEPVFSLEFPCFKSFLPDSHMESIYRIALPIIRHYECMEPIPLAKLHHAPLVPTMSLTKRVFASLTLSDLHSVFALSVSGGNFKIRVPKMSCFPHRDRVVSIPHVTVSPPSITLFPPRVYAWCRSEPSISMICSPLIEVPDVLSMFQLSNSGYRSFGPIDMELLETVGDALSRSHVSHFSQNRISDSNLIETFCFDTPSSNVLCSPAMSSTAHTGRGFVFPLYAVEYNSVVEKAIRSISDQYPTVTDIGSLLRNVIYPRVMEIQSMQFNIQPSDTSLIILACLAGPVTLGDRCLTWGDLQRLGVQCDHCQSDDYIQWPVVSGLVSFCQSDGVQGGFAIHMKAPPLVIKSIAERLPDSRIENDVIFVGNQPYQPITLLMPFICQEFSPPLGVTLPLDHCTCLPLAGSSCLTVAAFEDTVFSAAIQSIEISNGGPFICNSQGVCVISDPPPHSPPLFLPLAQSTPIPHQLVARVVVSAHELVAAFEEEQVGVILRGVTSVVEISEEHFAFVLEFDPPHIILSRLAPLISMCTVLTVFLISDDTQRQLALGGLLDGFRSRAGIDLRIRFVSSRVDAARSIITIIRKEVEAIESDSCELMRRDWVDQRLSMHEQFVVRAGLSGFMGAQSALTSVGSLARLLDGCVTEYMSPRLTRQIHLLMN